MLYDIEIIAHYSLVHVHFRMYGQTYDQICQISCMAAYVA